MLFFLLIIIFHPKHLSANAVKHLFQLAEKLRMRGDEITKLRNQDSPRYIYQIMLLGKLCGHADQYCKDTGKCFVPDGNLFALSNSDKAEPAYHTMYGRKQICRGIK